MVVKSEKKTYDDMKELRNIKTQKIIYLIVIMYHYKATTYEKVEKPKQDKKFKQNSYEEIRKKS